MSGFAVAPDDLEALDAYVAAAASHARAAVSRLQAEASALFSTGWHGAAASAFRLGWEQWLDGAQAVLAAMAELAALLGAAGGGYDQTEDAVRTSLAAGPA